MAELCFGVFREDLAANRGGLGKHVNTVGLQRHLAKA